MNVPNKFISPLDEDIFNELDDLVKNSKKARVRQRAQAIILSSKQLSIDEIAEISGVVRNTVSSWIDNWEQFGLDGLHDKDRPGGPPKLNAEEKELLLDLARETPRSVTNMITALFEETGKLLSESTIKRLLKAAGLKWFRGKSFFSKNFCLENGSEKQRKKNQIRMNLKPLVMK